MNGMKWHAIFLTLVTARIHDLEFNDDNRVIIDLSSFAYNERGLLHVNVTKFQLNENDFKKAYTKGNEDFRKMLEGKAQIGFVLEKLNSQGSVRANKNHGDQTGPDICLLHEKRDDQLRQVIKMKFEMTEGVEEVKEIEMSWDPDLKDQNIITKITDSYEGGDHCIKDSDEEISRKRRDEGRIRHGDETDNENSIRLRPRCTGILDFSFDMTWNFTTGADGLYELTFHNCFNAKEDIEFHMSQFHLKVIEQNYDANFERHYLSSGDIALPMVYGFCAVLFFLATFIWLGVLRQKDHTVFKIHYLMLTLVFFKAFSVMFHAIDFRFLDKEGKTDTWTIIFYVVHLLKGGILIVTLTLIGSGWAFIKYVLAERERFVFLIVVPLQVFVNVAYIIFTEKDEGDKDYTTWSHFMILLDLLCYAIILWPVYWSIRHLERSSQTDGKAAQNLEKLDLFRNFYVMFVLYIYFTRIVVFILRITMPPHLTWVDEFCEEIATLVFFILTGYKFRPGCNNPYFKMDDIEAEVLTETGLTEKVQKRRVKNKSDKPEAQNLLDGSDDEDTIFETSEMSAKA